MKITIIPTDNCVVINGIPKKVTFSIDPNILAVQWDGQRGTVESKAGGAYSIASIADFQSVIDAYYAAPSEPQTSEQVLEGEEYLASYRYERENDGVTVNGIPVKTDIGTRTNLLGARIRAEKDQNYTLKWKSLAGFIVLGSADIITISDAVADHVQKCFDAESEVLANLSPGDTREDIVAAFDAAFNPLIEETSPEDVIPS